MTQSKNIASGNVMVLIRYKFLYYVVYDREFFSISNDSRPILIFSIEIVLIRSGHFLISNDIFSYLIFLISHMFDMLGTYFQRASAQVPILSLSVETML